MIPVTKHQSPIDKRPFQARQTLDRQVSLEDQYRRIAIDELAAALEQMRGPAATESGRPRRIARS